MFTRIVEGIYPGKKIYYYDRNATITPPAVRKCLFDSIKHHKNNDYTFLDFGCGSGIVGLEALSQGCKNVTFMAEENKECKNIEDSLLDMTNITGNYNVVSCSLFNPLMGKPVDIVYIFPPDNRIFLIGKYINRLFKANWIDENTIICTLTHRKSHCKQQGFKQKTFGKYKLDFFQFHKDLRDNKLFTFKKHKKKTKHRVNLNNIENFL